MSAALSPAAEQFLRDHLASPLQLDVLIVLHDEADRWWTAEAIASQLRTAEPAVSAALETLGRSNVLDVRVGGSLSYRFAPVAPALARTIDEIATAHYYARNDLVTTLFAIQRKAGAARRIADAFRLKDSDG